MLKNALKAILRSRSFAPVSKSVSRMCSFIENERRESGASLLKIARSQSVLSGIFKGMKWPVEKSYGGVLLPIIVGSYEEELQSHIAGLLEKDYKEIINIGCGEGYYAVGLALHTGPETTVFAYDLDQAALNACRSVAAANNVGGKIVFGAECTAEALSKFDFHNGLVVCDCEGCEAEIFTAESVRNLSKCDLVIELHEFQVPGIKKRLTDLFAASHSIRVVTTHSYHRHVRRSPSGYRDILAGLNYEDKMRAMDEYRPGPMEWLVLDRK